MIALAEDDAAVFQRIIGRGGQDHDAGTAASIKAVKHPLQRLGLNKRRVAIEDQNRALITHKRVLRLLDSVGGALLLRLMCDTDIATLQRLLDLVSAFADDDDAFLGTQTVDAV